MPSDETLLYTPLPPTVSNPVRVAWCYPADYGVSMASLGYLLLFQRMDTHPAIAVQRYTQETMVPLSRHDVDVVGFSFSFELDCLTVLTMLAEARIPARAAQRTEDHPLVFSGGPVPMTNPEPYADFFDFFLIGEGEELLPEALMCLRDHAHLPRAERLKALALSVPGVYVPSLVQVHYASADGPVTGFTPLVKDLPFPVQKRTLSSLAGAVAASPILSEASVFGHRFLVEVMRGCSHRCRFCLASYSMLPARGATAEELIATLADGLQHTRQVGLLGALIADHPEFEQICSWLSQQPGVNVSFGALRVDTLTPRICETLVHSGSRTLTVAIESGSPALRQRINKHLKQDTILAAMQTVAASGLKGVKFYGMVGLPDEEDQDIEATIDLLRQIKRQHPRLDLVLGCSTFVPKAWTPFQWMPRLDTRTLKQRQERLRKGLLKVADFRPSSAKWDDLQALFSRGDRRLSVWIEAFHTLGGSHGAVNRVEKLLRKEQRLLLPSLEWYADRERPQHEVFPWDSLQLAVPRSILYQEGQPTPTFRSLRQQQETQLA